MAGEERRDWEGQQGTRPGRACLFRRSKEKVQNVEEKGQAGQAHPRTGLSLQAPEGKWLVLKLELTVTGLANEKRTLSAVVGAAHG